MLAKSGSLPTRGAWAYEVKWDGFRAIVSSEGPLRVRSRRGWNMTEHVRFLEAHPDQLVALKELLGHNRIETTMVYLRRKDKARAMESVRDLSWASSKTVSEDAGHLFLPAERGSGFSSQPQEAHTGFDPVPPP